MAYYLYRIEEKRGKRYLRYEDDTSLAGCNNGLIATKLSDIIPQRKSGPMRIPLPLGEILAKEGLAFVIDIMPNSTKKVSMAVVTDVYLDIGHYKDPWTIALMRLELAVDLPNPKKVKDLDKEYKEYFPWTRDADVVYTINHFAGSIKAGKIFGTWNFRRGAIDSALLWPITASYFFDCIGKRDPEFLKEQF